MTKKERTILLQELQFARKLLGHPSKYYKGALEFDSFSSDGLSFENEYELNTAFGALDEIIEKVKKGKI